MPCIWTKGGLYTAAPFDSESDLESAILQVQDALFGPNRIYIDIKKKIGAKDGLRNIPDGYVLDLSGSKPRLFVVENELAAHDPLRHIAVQILQFSLSFEAEPIAVKKVLLHGLSALPAARTRCEEYAAKNTFRNLDHMLEWLVFESPFSALVVIDEMPDNLENVLAKKFQFGVEVLTLARYQNSTGERFYHFEPFLADLSGPSTEPAAATKVSPSEIDTVIVPAREDGFNEVFMRENRWYAVRIHGSVRPQIKFIAAYQVAPVSAITHVAPVRSIEPWKDTGKVVVNFAEPASPIGPIRMAQAGRIRSFQSLRYTTKARLDKAKSLDDIWPGTE
jgi:hypothetical protein